MKWTNKGHQFDKIGERFIDVQYIYIYGCTQKGASLLSQMQFMSEYITAFVDMRAEEIKCYCGKEVISPQELYRRDNSHSVVIVTLEPVPFTQGYFAQSGRNRVAGTLRMNGFEDGVSLFDIESWVSYYQHIFALYNLGKLVSPYNLIQFTEKCNLNCKYCSQQKWRRVKPLKELSFDETKRLVDTTFEFFDFVDDLGFTGGEPFIYPYLYDALNYLMDNYVDRVASIVIFTNGFFDIEKSDLLLPLLKHPKVKLTFSDYTNAIKNEKIVSVIKTNIEKLKSLGVCVNYSFIDWHNIGDYEPSNFSNDRLIAQFDSCLRANWVTFTDDGEIGFPHCSTCYYDREFVPDIANEIENQITLIKDIKNNPRAKYILLEQMLGFCENGFVSLCDRCNGRYGLNKRKVVAGEQFMDSEVK